MVLARVEFENAADVLVGHAPGEENFPAEALERSGVLGEDGHDCLPRDMNAELGVERLVDFAHPVASHQADNYETVREWVACEQLLPSDNGLRGSS